jgi:uncharacterized repeat protein (TIGR03803 family)
MKTNTCGQSNPIEQLPDRRICTSRIVPLLMLWKVAACMVLMVAGQARAQTFTNLYCFTARVQDNDNGAFTNSDGGFPSGGLILSANKLYGTAGAGGSSGNGTVFAVNTDGTGFTNLHSFTAFPFGHYTNTDGANPSASLVLSGNALYGTAEAGGGGGVGTVFALDTDGSGFTNLHSFTPEPYGTNGDGGNPESSLIILGNTLYGTASGGGGYGGGTVFAVNTDGTGFTNLHTFTGGSDGANPSASLVLSGNTLYGTAVLGGTNGSGTVFALNTDGSGFTNLHSFTPEPYGTNGDGANPSASLVLSGNTLYGTTVHGGSGGIGTVFAVNTDGTGFTNLYTFTGGSDGAFFYTGLILSGNTLYGTAYGKRGFFGGEGNGTVFAVNTDGTGFTVLHYFLFRSEPPVAVNGLVLSGNTLYGTTGTGGTNDMGTVFSIFIQPQLTLIPSGPYMILTWPTNYNSFTLESTTNLTSPAAWTPVSPQPVIIGSQNIAIGTMPGTKQFYRLSGPLP